MDIKDGFQPTEEMGRAYSEQSACGVDPRWELSLAKQPQTKVSTANSKL